MDSAPDTRVQAQQHIITWNPQERNARRPGAEFLGLIPTVEYPPI